jgi:hypothetical protein
MVQSVSDGKDKIAKFLNNAIPIVFFVDFSLTLKRNKKWTIGF